MANAFRGSLGLLAMGAVALALAARRKRPPGRSGPPSKRPPRRPGDRPADGVPADPSRPGSLDGGAAAALAFED